RRAGVDSHAVADVSDGGVGVVEGGGGVPAVGLDGPELAQVVLVVGLGDEGGGHRVDPDGAKAPAKAGGELVRGPAGDAVGAEAAQVEPPAGDGLGLLDPAAGAVGD